MPDVTGDAGSADAGTTMPGTDAATPGADAVGADAASAAYEEGDPCPRDAMGSDLLSPSCVGDDLVYCSGDRVRVTDCTALGDRCIPGAGGALPRCDGGVYVACSVATSTGTCADQDNALRCAGGHPNASGYTYTIPCSTFGDYECVMGATEGGCLPRGSTTCDSDMPSSACSADGAGITSCRDGLEYTVPCEDRLPGSVCDLGPGDEPVCVPPGSMRCDARTFHGSCIGERTVEECNFVTGHVGLAGCPASTSCRVSELGFAACVPEESRSCDPETHVARCFDGDRLARCDSRGFESDVDCTRSGEEARCIPDSPARCGVADMCDVLTYTARCEGDVALNCRMGGWVESRTCSPFVPCRVTDGVAGCGG